MRTNLKVGLCNLQTRYILEIVFYFINGSLVMGMGKDLSENEKRKIEAFRKTKYSGSGIVKELSQFSQ